MEQVTLEATSNIINQSVQTSSQMAIISIGFYYNDKPDEKRTENALWDKSLSRPDPIDDDGNFIEEEDRVYHFNGYSLTDDEIFYIFQGNEPIIGVHADFTVTDYTVIDENP